MCRDQRSLHGSIAGLCGACVWVAVWWLAVMPAWGVCGPEESPEKSPDEPQTLLAPVELLPVNPESAPSAELAGPELFGPPVKLAPELNTLMGPGAGQTARAIDRIKPANFKEITPGEATRDLVLETLGEPAATSPRGDSEVWTYAIGPFPQVRVTLHEDVVSSIVIHLASPTARVDVSRELGLDDLQPVVVRDEQQRPLGEVYPERGLMFAYADGAADGMEARVEQVILETITVEPFLLRVQQQPAEYYAQRLADLRVVQRLAPEDPVAFGLAARIELACGRPLTALAAAQKAVELHADSVEYQLLLADAKRRLGQTREALELVRGALRQSDLSPLQQARAHYLLGRMLATTTPRNYRQAMEETVAAIKVAAGHVGGEDRAARVEIQQQLVDAELSLAEILAYGPWKQKHQVIPQWLVTAEKAANELIEQDGGPRDVLLSVYNTSLHCLLVLDGQGTPDHIADAAIQLGRDLIAQTEDDEYRAGIEWRLGTGLWLAAQVAYRQEHADAALEFANNAEVLLASAGKSRSESPESAHHLAQLRFLTGSIYAINRQDDASAIRWFDQALPHLQPTYPDSLLDERGLIGEQLVSIGISLWDTGRRNTAVSVTEEGASLIAQAVTDGSAKRAALSVPYQNLAEMHRQLGNRDEADRLAHKAAEVDPDASQGVKRR